MDDNEIHYLTYDADAIWDDMVSAYIDAGGDVLYPGDEKEMLMRGMQSIVMQAFAGIDNALRMDTLRYAVRDYLDIYGEKRNCYRIQAAPATAKVRLTFLASGESKVIEAGTALTADGAVLYLLDEDITQSGLAGTMETTVTCSQSGAVGNGLYTGVEMQFLIPMDGVSNVTVIEDASGGQDAEDDETYRERIRLYGLATVTTGPASQYESAAESVTSEIIDAKALNEGAGQVGVYLLLASDTGSTAILQSVREKLTPEDVRPLTDSVSVQLATKRPYELTVQYTASRGSNVTAAVAEAVKTYQAWQDTEIGRAFNPDMLMSYLYQAGCVRVIFKSGSHFDGGSVEYTEIGNNEYCKGTILTEAVSA